MIPRRSKDWNIFCVIIAQAKFILMIPVFSTCFEIWSALLVGQIGKSMSSADIERRGVMSS